MNALLNESDANEGPTRLERKMIVLVSLASGEELKRSFPEGVEITFGRDRESHVVLPSAFVSRRHLSLALEGEEVVVDEGSSLGTHIQGELLQGERRRYSTLPLSLKVGPYRVLVRTSEKRVQSAACRRKAHGRLLERLDLGKRKVGAAVTPELRAEVQAALTEIVAEEDLEVPEGDRKRLAAELVDEALGLGPLESLLSDERVSEVMVVDPSTIYAERGGRLELTGRAFTDSEAVRAAIERIVTPLGRRIDESSPLVDARLPDGSRVNAVIPPLALRGPCITIRKFPARRLTMRDLTSAGSLSERMALFLSRSVALKKNIVISGGTGSGKTTLLNVLSASIGQTERVVTIEDAAELNLAQPHVVGLESKPPNLEGRGEFSIRDLLKNALRMRPDRIVVGECRGGEALDMLQAMNTGHEGSMTTTHANSPSQAVSRIETLCLMGGLDLPAAAIRRQIAESLDMIVQQSRLSDGSRRITEVSEVVGLTDEGQVELRSLFVFEPGSSKPEHRATGFMPTFLPALSREFSEREGAVF
jgi:pilus assembly protein CpaF